MNAVVKGGGADITAFLSQARGSLHLMKLIPVRAATGNCQCCVAQQLTLAG